MSDLKPVEQLFRIAAELMSKKGEHQGCCSAISGAMDSGAFRPEDYRAARLGFRTAFNPEGSGGYWIGRAQYEYHDAQEATQARDRRVFVLLIMAELAKDAGL